MKSTPQLSFSSTFMQTQVRHKGSGPCIKWQFGRFIAQTYTQESSQLTFSTKLAPDKVNGIQEGLDLNLLWQHSDKYFMYH